MISSAIELRLPPDMAYVSVARLLVTLAARNSGLGSERAEDLRIAVSEATTNAIRAQQESDSQGSVVLVFGPGDHGFEVVVKDAGPGFEPLEAEALADRDWRLEGGLGVTIIRGLADEVDFERVKGMTVNMRFSVGMES